MPTISRFRGITITMYFREGIHASRPHFHASYAGEQASFDAVDLTSIAGKLPLRIEAVVRRWAQIHRAELLANWERGRRGQKLQAIEPLK